MKESSLRKSLNMDLKSVKYYVDNVNSNCAYIDKYNQVLYNDYIFNYK